jgi:hypothetical protein
MAATAVSIIAPLLDNLSHDAHDDFFRRNQADVQADGNDYPAGVRSRKTLLAQLPGKERFFLPASEKTMIASAGPA